MTRQMMVLVGVMLFGGVLASVFAALAVARVRAQGEPPEASPAGCWVRVAALAVDYLIIAVLFTVVLGLLALCEAVGWAGGGIWQLGFYGLFLIPLGYFSLPYFRGKQTWGKRAAGLVMERTNGDACGGWRALGRSIVLWVFPLNLLLLIDALVLACHPQKRSLHDLLVGSRVRQASRPPVLLACTPFVYLATMLLLVAGLRGTILQTLYLPSSSMAPTLQEQDKVVANKLIYHLGTVRRGDLVVFYPPRAPRPLPMPPGDLFCKRVVGLPGETIEIRGGDGIYINGKRLHDPLPVPSYDWPLTAYRTSLPPYRLAADEYFVLGDNRNASLDSHAWCAANGNPMPGVPRKNIIGKVTLIFWPPNHARSLRSPY